MEANGWHLKKEVPLALIASILVQTIALVWFISKLDSRVDNLEVKSLEQQAYDRRQWDDINSTRQTVANNDKRIATIEAKQDHMIRQIDKLVDRLIGKVKE